MAQPQIHELCQWLALKQPKYKKSTVKTICIYNYWRITKNNTLLTEVRLPPRLPPERNTTTTINHVFNDNPVNIVIEGGEIYSRQENIVFSLYLITHSCLRLVTIIIAIRIFSTYTVVAGANHFYLSHRRSSILDFQ